MRKIVFLISAVLLMTACGSGDNTSESFSDGETDVLADSVSLKVAVMPTIDCLPLFVAAENGMFERQGLSVSLYPYDAQMDCDTAFLNGRVDVMATDLVRCERMKSQGVDVHYITASELHWQLVASRMTRVRRLSQLEDKMIAMTRFSATAMLADMLVDSSTVTNEHVFRIQVNDVNVRLRMLESEVMDAMLLPEPQATVARQKEAVVLYDTRWNDVCMGVLVARSEAMADTLRQHRIETLMRVYDEACDTINSWGLQTFHPLISRQCKVRAEMLDSIADIHFNHSHQPRQVDIDRANAWLKNQ